MEEEKPEVTPIRVYKYRWVVLGVFCLFTVVNFMQFLQFSIIASIVTKFYNVSSFAIDATGLIFFIVYIVTFVPISFLIEKYNLKVTVVTGTGLTLVGNLVKLGCSEPDRFWVALLGQFFCALGQVYMMSIPSKFASTWFGPEEVSTASAIAVLGTYLGVAIGCVLPPFLVINGESSDVANDLHHMIIYNAIATGVVFVITIVFFRARPTLPPSQSQLNLLENESREFFKDFGVVIRNKDFRFLLLSFGICNGLWNSFGILLNNMYLNFFPNAESDAGLIGLLAIISGGCIGSVIFGVILDKTHRFKSITFIVFLSASITFVFVAYTLIIKSRVGTFIAIPVFGFFTASTLVIGFEYVLEVTYPLPESCGCSILNAVIYMFAIIATLITESLFDAIGYLYTFVVVLICFSICCLNILGISSHLRRRDANLANNAASSEGNEESTIDMPETA